jgi:predicted lipoprotein with Yx(FWY)xxD motif
MRKLLVALVAIALLLPSVGIGAQRLTTVKAHGSRFGTVLFEGRGYVLYAFTRDPHGHSACTGTCARAWPPFIVHRRLVAANGARTALLGTTRRADGTRQATYGGRPLYFYVGDRKPGQISCQNVSEFGGLWLVVRRSGKLVR